MAKIRITIEIDTGATPKNANEREQAILDALALGQELTLATLSSSADTCETTTRRTIESLVERGKLVVVNVGGYGRGNARTYRLASSDESTRRML